MAYVPGDLLWYRQVTPGGYGFPNRVPAVYVRTTPKRIVIEVLMRTGVRREIGVAPANIMPRQAGEGVEWPR